MANDSGIIVLNKLMPGGSTAAPCSGSRGEVCWDFIWGGGDIDIHTVFRYWWWIINDGVQAQQNFPHSTVIRLFLTRDAMHKRGLYRHVVFVRLSVMFVYSVKTNKRIYKILSPF